MAKKKAAKKVNKSKAIRDYMAAHPSAGPTEVSEALTKKGIEVTAAFVSTVKSMAKNKKTGAKRGRPKTKPTPAESTVDLTNVNAAEIALALPLVEEVGIEGAIEVLHGMAELGCWE